MLEDNFIFISSIPYNNFLLIIKDNENVSFLM